MQEPKHDQVRSRNEPFVERTATRIWYEHPTQDNPYIADQALCHGYDLMALMANKSFVEVFYLLFRGELPSIAEKNLLEQLMIGLINPGPRHPATRAAMNAGVGKSNPVNILPIATAVLGGECNGAGVVEDAMRFLRKHQGRPPREFMQSLLQADHSTAEIAQQLPGFGVYYGGVNVLAAKIAAQLAGLPAAGKAIHWGMEFHKALAPEGIGWLMPGVAAAVFADLGFQPRAGGCLFQLLSAPGLVAHGIELANKPITAMPFVKDENYVIER